MAVYTTNGERVEISHEDIQNDLQARLKRRGHVMMAHRLRLSNQVDAERDSPQVQTESTKYPRREDSRFPSGNQMRRIDVFYSDPWNDFAIEVKTSYSDLSASLEKQANDYQYLGYTSVLVAPRSVYNKMSEEKWRMADLNIEFTVENRGIGDYTTLAEDAPLVLKWI